VTGETHPEREPEGVAHDTERDVARGRAASTPFLLVGSVALTIWAVAGIVALIALAVWWLA
jgi:hypothetical protein